MSLPRTTVVIPCFNHGRFVAEAVRSCLAQEQADVRVVIVDDGSDDGTTPAACDECARQSPDRVVVVHQENKGLAAARNVGAAEATRLGGEWAGHYLTFLDADDWIEPTFVTRLHGAIAGSEHPVRVAVTSAITEARKMAGAEASAAAGSSTVQRADDIPPRTLANGVHRGHAPGVSNGHVSGDEENEPVAASGSRVSHAYCQERLVELHQMIWAVPDWDPMLMLVTNLHPVTTLIKRECFEAVGGFDETMREGYEDWDLWLKFVERGWAGVRVREPLFIWRRHSQNTMIVEAGKRHERLFGQLVVNHAELYRKHAEELLVLSNRLLRQSDANWLDESGEAIVIRDTRRFVRELITERDAARNEIAVQRQGMLNLDEAGQFALATECERQAAKLREQAAQIQVFAKEQVAALGAIGMLTRERNESRREGEQTRASLEVAVSEREQVRAELATTRIERDENRQAFEREQVASQAARVESQGMLESLRHAHAAAIAAYEAKPAVRFSHAIHRVMDRLPGPLSRLIKKVVRRAVRMGRGSR